jgi:hypothetical protein
MRHLAWVVACAGLLMAGCGEAVQQKPAAEPDQGAAARQEEQAGPGHERQTDPAQDLQPASGSQESENPSDSQEAKTPIVRSLLDAIDDADGEDGDVKDDLRGILRGADEELSQVLGENSRRLIEQANRKPSVPIIGPAEQPAAKPEAP